MIPIRTEEYSKRAGEALENPVLQNALADLQRRLTQATAALYKALPEGDALRDVAHDIRRRAVENLDVLLETLAENAQKNGAHVFFATESKAAVDYCLELARRHNVQLVVKGKSMVAEELGLNDSLMEAGIEVKETDLGEYIIQLAGERPSHILAPAIHRTRNEIGELFADKLGIEFTNDPPTLTQAARKSLREKFLAADMGISGCNQACAETGHITTLSNEGNIRMATTMPRIHVVVMGMERVAATLEDHEILFRLLARAVAAQKIAGYTSYIGGPRADDHIDGPEELHLIILDNGRSKILADPDFREILYCIRCGACLNVCPVYGRIGGHAYGHIYSGPIGAVVTPLMVGLDRAKDLCLGETLCGACKDACPVRLDIPKLLLRLRARIVEGDPRWGATKGNGKEKAIYTAWSWAIRYRPLYDLFLKMAAAGQRLFPKKDGMIVKLPSPFDGWTQSRDMPPISSKSFKERWADLKRGGQS
jgi:L-lactate dehydrogenase complex protein LldF